MAYVATAQGYLPPMTAAPGVLALQRALVWLVGASGAIVFIEPSPYELVTLAATVIFLATGLRLRLIFMPLLLLLFPLLAAVLIGRGAVRRFGTRAARLCAVTGAAAVAVFAEGGVPAQAGDDGEDVFAVGVDPHPAAGTAATPAHEPGRVQRRFEQAGGEGGGD